MFPICSFIKFFFFIYFTILYINSFIGGILVKTKIESESQSSELNKLVEEKQPLPEDIYYVEYPDGKRQFFQISNATEDMTTDEIQLYIALQQAKNIRSIKGWVTFFGALSVIGLVLGLLSLCIH